MITEFGIGIILGLISLFLFLLYQSFFTVEEGHVGVVTQFGKADLNSNGKLKIYSSGSHFKFPWGKVYYLSIMEQIVDLHESGTNTALAFDGTILQLESKLRYKINSENVYDYLFRIKDPLDHIKGLFASLLKYQIASFHSSENEFFDSSYALIRKERKLLNDSISTFCHNQLSGKYGIDFKSIDLLDILPPEELDKALNAVLNAQVEAETYFSRAEADCAQKKLAAKANVTIEESKAQATELEITTFGEYLFELEKENMLEEYIARRKSETLYDSKNVFIRSNV